MANHPVKNTGLSNKSKASRRDDQPAATSTVRLSAGKLWLFRLLALAGGPFVFLGLLELVLRLIGFGYPTAFLLRATQSGRDVFVQNNQFGWRFFGPRMSRLPEPFSISQNKAPSVIRIFVYGESAAKGEPQPAFGPARMLAAILSQRHPGTQFEVVNVAMTAINSHTIRLIADACAEANADIWVIYMGNNEVVGPFGAGTIFGHQTPPLWLIKGTLALKERRTGQWLDSLLAKWGKPAHDDGEWHGMKMFLDQQVRADDPRMASVYHHFEHNLADIIRTGQRNGAGIVVSTVAVNLRDCAPFASTHRNGFTGAEKAAWEQAYKLGIIAQDSRKWEEAAQQFQEAAHIDDRFAELRFRQGQCALALGQNAAAQKHLGAARDLDTLRFRCDRGLNDLIRQTATNRENERVLLADVENAFAAESQEALAGADLFYDHVHPNFKGNYLLATTLARQVERLLPTNLVAHGAVTWPSEVECACQLGWSDWSRLTVMQDVLNRIKSPPFVGQVDHEAQLRELAARVEELSPASQPAGLAAARRAVEAALRTAPEDAVLHEQLVSLRQLSGDLNGAVASARRGIELSPTNPRIWLQLGLLLVQQRQIEEATATFQRVVELDPMDIVARLDLAQSLRLLGRREEAIIQSQRAVQAQPGFSLAWINLGQLLEESAREGEADACYRKALAGHSSRVSDLVTLARFCRSRRWDAAAVTNYSAAIEGSPGDADLRVETGEYMLTLRRNSEAVELFADAVRLKPDSPRAHQLYGVVLGQLGRPVEAEQQFRETLRLEPDFLEARLNLGLALFSQGRSTESLACLEEVLRLSPTNELAARYAQTIRAKARAQP